MTQIAVSELTGLQLAEFVARARGREIVGNGYGYANGEWLSDPSIKDYRPDINGGQAMYLLEQDYIVGHWVYIDETGSKVYCVEYGDEDRWFESTEFKIAICRAVVASEFGEFVEVGK